MTGLLALVLVGLARVRQLLSRRAWPVLALANGVTDLITAAAAPATVDFANRTITGLVVPFGRVGETSQGRLIYQAGSLTWSDPSRVKLLVEHDQSRAIGYATHLEERADGIYGTFHVPPSSDGDAVLASAAARVRDGLSCGVQLDDVTRTHLRRANGAAVNGRGQLREVSAVSVPAFDDSRVAAVANVDLVVSAWDDLTPTERTAMLCSICGQRHAQGVACPTAAPVATATTPPQPAPDPAPQPAPPAPAPDPAPQPAPPAPAPDPAPQQPPLATAGAAAQVLAEASVYTLDGQGPSLVRDAFYAGMHHDAQAADRLARFNAQLEDGNAPSVMALAAVATTGGAGAAGPGFGIGQNTYRPDLFRSAVDAARPIISRLQTITITSSAPFTIPREGEFSGVDDHVEGTAHVPEGTLDGSDETLTPRAVSGAYRVSRELVDASNPAIDRIAVRAMIRDYRRLTEAKAAAALATVGAASATVTTLMGLRAELVDFGGDDDIVPDFVVAGRGFFGTLTSEVDADGRPMLATIGATNGLATVRAGYTGMTVDGVELVKARAIATDDGYLVEADAVLWAESRVQTFRFDEVEGPGVIKLALWAYCGAALLDTNGVERLSRV